MEGAWLEDGKGIQPRFTASWRYGKNGTAHPGEREYQRCRHRFLSPLPGRYRVICQMGFTCLRISIAWARLPQATKRTE
ncbi:hypothetical protein ACLK15_21725 [Escherichia coli]